MQCNCESFECGCPHAAVAAQVRRDWRLDHGGDRPDITVGSRQWKPCPNEADPNLRIIHIGEVCSCCYEGFDEEYRLPVGGGSVRAARSSLTPGQQKSDREGKAEYAERKRLAALLSSRIGLPIEASKPYDWHAQARGGDPLPDSFTKGLPRGTAHLPVTCELGRG